MQDATAAPPGTPLWERLPRDLQQLIARFLVQKMLWQLLTRQQEICTLNTPRVRILSEEEHLAQIRAMMNATPLFDRELYTVYLLSVTIHRWQHHHAFGNGLVRIAWEVHDRQTAAAQGLSHVSVPWERRSELLQVEKSRLRDVLFTRLRQIARKGYEMSGSHYLPEHYLVEVYGAICKGVHGGTLRWINGTTRKKCTDFLSAIVNAPWHGRTRKQEIEVRVRIKEAMHRSLASVPY